MWRILALNLAFSNFTVDAVPHRRRYQYSDHISEAGPAKNWTKSRVRSKVEHVLQLLKLKFGVVNVATVDCTRTQIDYFPLAADERSAGGCCTQPHSVSGDLEIAKQRRRQR